MIITALPEHLPALVEIYNQAIMDGFCTADMETFSVEEKTTWFFSHDERHPLFVYVLDGRPAAWLSVSPYRKGRQALQGVREVSVYVDRSERGKGLASILLQHAINISREIGAEFYIAIILGANEKSIRMVKKLGFEEWGRMPGVACFDGVRCDHVYMGRNNS